MSKLVIIQLLTFIVIVSSILYPHLISKIDFSNHRVLETFSIFIGMILPLSLLVILGYSTSCV